MTDREAGESIYPCQYPVKVIGENGSDLEKVIIREMALFDEVISPGDMTKTKSKNGKYVSITFTIVAGSREHVEHVYKALGAQKEVKMVL